MVKQAQRRVMHAIGPLAPPIQSPDLVEPWQREWQNILKAFLHYHSLESDCSQLTAHILSPESDRPRRSYQYLSSHSIRIACSLERLVKKLFLLQDFSQGAQIIIWCRHWLYHKCRRLHVFCLKLSTMQYSRATSSSLVSGSCHFAQAKPCSFNCLNYTY